MTTKQHGIMLAIIGASLWGTMGAALQYLFSHTGLTVAWMAALRLIIAGPLLLAWTLWKSPASIGRLVRNIRAWLSIIALAIFGLINTQIAYSMTIAHANAPTATVLQYLSPAMIIIYFAIRQKQWPRRIDVLTVIISMLGAYLLMTNGNFHTLKLSPTACWWGVETALGATCYTLIPRQLVARFDTRAVMGLAMTVGGVIMLPLLVTTPLPRVSGADWFLIIYTAIGGTMLAYSFYIASLRYISAGLTGVLGVFEPLVATFLAVLFLGTTFGWVQVMGGILILTVTIIQAWPGASN